MGEGISVMRMATSNYERVGKALDFLKVSLRRARMTEQTFCADSLAAQPRSSSGFEGIQYGLDDRERHRPGAQ